MLYKSIPLTLVDTKAGSDSMEFSAYASTFGNTDHGGDVIVSGAFKNTIQDPNRDRPLLWQHDPRTPIGIEKSIVEDGKGLLGTWEIIDTQAGLDAYKLMKRGAIRSMSIGYIPKPGGWKMDGDVRMLKEIDLLENSVVSIPMNDQARITNVKTETDLESVIRTYEKLLREVKSVDALDYTALSLSDLTRTLTDTVAAFRERCHDLLAKLQAGDFDLTDSKRTDLQALLVTFTEMDAVRSDAEAVLAHKQSEPEQEQPSSDVETDSPSGLAVALELRRRKLRLRGIEV
jgi:hypothetical protein